MFSLHLDTAQTWRGGQHQVLLTVLGLRRRGHRAALAAQPRGELYRRAATAIRSRRAGTWTCTPRGRSRGCSAIWRRT